MPRILMYLTHDEQTAFTTHEGRLVVRIRAWQQPKGTPLVLAESLGKILVTDYSGKIATFTYHCILKGRVPDFIYCERDRSMLSAYYCVHFLPIRHAFVCEGRRKITHRAIEDTIGCQLED